jgi:hypothetical protein
VDENVDTTLFDAPIMNITELGSDNFVWNSLIRSA